MDKPKIIKRSQLLVLGALAQAYPKRLTGEQLANVTRLWSIYPPLMALENAGVIASGWDGQISDYPRNRVYWLALKGGGNG